MDVARIPQALVAQARAQHAALHEMVEHIRALAHSSAAGSTQAALQSLTDQFIRLRSFLERHFTQEEEGGWLEEAVSRIPQLSPQLRELEAEHQQIIVGLSDVVTKLQTASMEDRLQADLESRIKLILDQIVGHEEREEEILKRGYNDDADFTP